VIARQRLLEGDGIAIDDVACRHQPGRGEALEDCTAHMLVLVRRGCFVREAEGASVVLDPTLAYFQRPGDEQRYDHPHEGGDDCTALELSEVLVASLWGGEPRLPGEPVPISPGLDVEHRMLLAAVRRGARRDELVERAVVVAAGVLTAADSRRVESGRPGSDRLRRAIVDDARQLLAADPGLPLSDLARELAVSPHHLSRIFRARTGHSIARHRMRLRARAALERLAGGDRNLARLAAELGFSDQSHLCRVIRDETGQTPGALRAAIA
jgi:AraC-like DNA-binding protein